MGEEALRDVRGSRLLQVNIECLVGCFHRAPAELKWLAIVA
jgi:hypothetical protein